MQIVETTVAKVLKDVKYQRDLLYLIVTSRYPVHAYVSKACASHLGTKVYFYDDKAKTIEFGDSDKVKQIFALIF